MAVPNIFGSATSAIPLSQLDQNFATAITLGNTAVYLGNTTTSLGNVTLTNVTVSSGNVTVTGANVSGNLTFTGTGNRITGDFSNSTHANRVVFQSSTTNDITGITAFPNGTNQIAQLDCFNQSSNTANSSFATVGITATEMRLRSSITGTGTYLPMTFYTGGSERMRIDTSGNVGIGTTSPAYPLTLGNNKRFGSLNTAGAGVNFAILDNSNNLTFGDDSANTGSLTIQSRGDTKFVVNTAERMRITDTGNLLVGTTSQVSQGKGNIAFNGSSHQGLNLQETANQSSAGFMYFQYNTTVLGTITRNVLTNAVLYNTTSDIRLKENIENANSALTTISNIKVRQYDWIGCENSHQDYGFIAQELAEVVSGIVTKGRTEEDTWAVDYGKLTPILCKAIQEQQALITQLQADVAALKSN